jgi:hypothetical protein
MAERATTLQALGEYIKKIEYDQFERSLSDLPTDLPDLKLKDGRNSTLYLVFHYICQFEVTDDGMLKFVNTTVSFVRSTQLQRRYSSSSSSVLSEMLNAPAGDRGRTPLFEAVLANKRVSFT